MKHVKSKRGSELLGQILLWALLIGALLVFSVPFFFMISNSFEEFSYVLPYPPRLLPTRLDFSAYRHILELEIFPTAVRNSVVNTCVTVVLSVFISTLSAYGFARIRFPGRDKLFGIYLFTLMMPGFLNIIPQFLILKGIHLPGPAGFSVRIGHYRRRRTRHDLFQNHAAPLQTGDRNDDDLRVSGLLGGVFYRQGARRRG